MILKNLNELVFKYISLPDVERAIIELLSNLMLKLQEILLRSCLFMFNVLPASHFLCRLPFGRGGGFLNSKH